MPAGYIHSLEVTAANEHDVTVGSKPIREDDTVVYGDAGYQGLEKRPEILADHHKSSIDYRFAQRPGKRRTMQQGIAKDCIWSLLPNIFAVMHLRT